jgi:hypothetical protein
MELFQLLPPHAVLQAAKDALADYFTKKKSRLSIITVKAMLRTAPSPEWAPVVIGHHQSARTDFLKCEALQLLLITLQPAKVRKAFVLLPRHINSILNHATSDEDCGHCAHWLLSFTSVLQSIGQVVLGASAHRGSILIAGGAELEYSLG